MTPGRSNMPPPVVDPGGADVAAPPEAAREDCRTCDMRAACITWGWRSPGGLWFEHAVILKPRPGCRGFVGRGDDIRAHFAGISPPTSDTEH